MHLQVVTRWVVLKELEVHEYNEDSYILNNLYVNVALYYFLSNKSKNKSCSVYYIGTFCFLLCLPNLDSLAARENDLSEFA